MHQRDICLCPKCIAAIAVDEDEARTRARMHIAAIGAASKRKPYRRVVTSLRETSNPRPS